MQSNKQRLEKSVVSYDTVNGGNKAKRVERTATCETTCSLRYASGHRSCEFFASVQPSCTAHFVALVTSEAGEEVAWHQTDDSLPVNTTRASLFCARCNFFRVDSEAE